MEERQSELHKEEGLGRLQGKNVSVSYTRKNVSMKCTRKGGRQGILQGKEVSVSYTRKMGDWGDCNGTTSA